MIWKKENLQYGEEYAMHYANLSKIKDFGSQNVSPAPGMTTSKGPDVSWTDVNLREKAHG